MPSPLLAIAVGFLILFAVGNWKFSLILVSSLCVLAYFIGTETTLLIFVGYGVLTLVIEPGTALVSGLLILALVSLIGLETTIFFLLVVIIVLTVLLAFALSAGQESKARGLFDTSGIVLAIFLTGFSTFVSRIELLGTIPSPNQFFELLFSEYPGQDFAEALRNDFVKHGAELIEEGAITVEKTPDALLADIRHARGSAGQFLSNGEANLALLLAVFSFVSFLPNPGSLPPWLAPPEWTGALLSGILLVAVGLRFAALDMVLYDEVDSREGKARLAAMSAWNDYLANGAKVLQVFAQFKAVNAISPAAYRYYLNWVFKKSQTEEGATTLGLVSQWRELMCITIADRGSSTPSRVSRNLFGENVFENTDLTEFGFEKSEAGICDKGHNSSID